MDENNWRFRIGAALGGMSGLAGFFAVWAYCAARFGLLGAGLGWIPGAAASAVVGLAAFLLWDMAVRALSATALRAQHTR